MFVGCDRVCLELNPGRMVVPGLGRFRTRLLYFRTWGDFVVL